MKILLRGLLLAALLGVVLPAAAQEDRIGIVIMHGKGGSPNSPHIGEFARLLEERGFLVANLEMAWSRRRNYDVPVIRAEEEVAQALAGLRARGATKAFVAGHSQGGAFALHLAGRVKADGYVAIASGGNVAGPVFRSKLGPTLARARKLVAEGKGNEPAELMDYEGSRGAYPIVSPPAAYVTWFDPEGAMNMSRAAKTADPATPILFVMPTQDYPGLMKTNPRIFGALPRHPLTRSYEPDADHLGAPAASVDEIARWAKAVAAGAAK